MADIPPQLAGNIAPLTGAQQLSVKIESLKTAMLKAHPAMPGLLREIWAALKKDDELVYLLKPEEIAAVVDGLEKQTQITIVTETVKKKSTSSLKNMTLADLGM